MGSQYVSRRWSRTDQGRSVVDMKHRHGMLASSTTQIRTRTMALCGRERVDCGESRDRLALFGRRRRQILQGEYDQRNARRKAAGAVAVKGKDIRNKNNKKKKKKQGNDFGKARSFEQTSSTVFSRVNECVNDIGVAVSAIDAGLMTMQNKIKELEERIEKMEYTGHTMAALVEKLENSSSKSHKEKDCVDDKGRRGVVQGDVVESSHMTQIESNSLSSSSSSSSQHEISSYGAGPLLIANALKETKEVVNDDKLSTNDLHDSQSLYIDQLEESSQAKEHEEVDDSKEKAEGGETEQKYPELCKGSDDVEYIAKLHRLLSSHGFCVSEEEEEDFLFEESTEEAVRTFQACNNIDETGFTCVETWKRLSDASNDSISSNMEEQTSAKQRMTGSLKSPEIKWPTLETGIGGRDVHLLQRALAVRK